MNNAYLYFLLSITMICLSSIGCVSQVKKTPTHPNIVIIYTDDQGYGDMSALNPEAKFRTPNMDKIANEGAIFTDGHSSDAVCTPSRYSLLTGRYSWRTSLKKGVLGADGACLIEKDRITIASLLKENGYSTAMVGKWHLQMDFVGTKGKNRDWTAPFTDGPIEKGFDYFFGIPASMNFGVLTYLENEKVMEPPVLWTNKKKVTDPRSFRDNARPKDYRMTPPYKDEPSNGRWIEVASSFNDELVLETFAKKAVDYINKSAKKDKPFFLYLPLTSPHLPHCTHPDFKGRSNCGNYGDFMEETDYRVGQVLDALDANGIAENTLVIFSSDNGAETNYVYHRDTYNHYSSLHFRGAKRDIYEGGHRVPFLMRWPATIKAGIKIDMPVCQTDYLATIADIVGVKLPDEAGEDSYSLLPAMKEETYDDSLRGAVIHHSASGYFAIRQGKWKLNMLDNGTVELFDIEEDSSETMNVMESHPKIVEKLKEQFVNIVKHGRSTPGQPQDFVKSNWPQLAWMEL